MLKSNVNIRSNIYIRNDKDLKYDFEFINNVSGYRALKKLEPLTFGTNNALKLNDIQKKELAEGVSCSYCKSGETIYGKILKDNKLVWEGRCEYKQCSRFDICDIAIDFDRESVEIEKTNNIEFEVSKETFEYLGIDVNSISINDLEIQNVDDIFNDSYLIDTEDCLNDNEKHKIIDEMYMKINDSKSVIEAPIDSKILVNAGPGTGKTYTVIQRLLHIIKNNMADFDKVLVLCYSRSAVKVIKDRIEFGIFNNEIPLDAKKIIVGTLDSFATSYLIALEVNDLYKLSYSERVEHFIKEIVPDNFAHFEYLIIDEIQDLVNERALMVLDILRSINCGFLALGDTCQAIYDYDCEGETSVKSTDFYKQLDEILGTDAFRYELIKNNRQNETLADYTNKIREVLLVYDEAKSPFYIEELLKQVEILGYTAEKFNLVDNGNGSIVILCRTNGEAEQMSSILHKKKILHNFIGRNGVRAHFDKWIATVFWDYVEDVMLLEEFVKRYTIRMGEDEVVAERVFNELLSLTGGKDRLLRISNMIDKLCVLDLNTYIHNVKNNVNLTVSTIHKAKGMEFDRVYILSNDYNNLSFEESKVQYVATTRPMQELSVLEKSNQSNWYIKNVKDRSRSFKTGYKGKRSYCSGITLGIDGDVDEISFISTELHENVYDVQEYISENVKKFDELEIKRDFKFKRYLIFHNEYCIGALSKDIDKKFWDVINMTNNKNSIPMGFSNIFVEDITTILYKSYDEYIPLQFRESKMWIGVSIAGVGKVDWRS